jgi:Flp pilus assembly secretin CpaC/tetratricopeptide (TPR) repeat protein
MWSKKQSGTLVEHTSAPGKSFPADGRGLVTMMRVRRMWVGAAALTLALVGVCKVAEAGASSRDANARLGELADDAKRANQSKQAMADALYDAAKRAYDSLDYSEALKLINRALEADPAHDKARELAARVRSMLGVRRDWIAAGLERLSDAKRVQITESLMELQRAVLDAAEHKRKSMLPGEPGERPDRLLSRQIAELDEAVSLYKRVLEIIKWMPYQVDLRNEQNAAAKELQDCTGERAAREEALRVYKRKEAIDQAASNKSDEQRFLVDRLNQLISMAQVQFTRGKFQECEDICERVLNIDPLSTEATALAQQSKQKRHTYKEAELYDQTQNEWRGTMNNVEANAVPYTERIRYPDNWEEILRRVDRAGKIIDTGEEPEWANAIRRKLDRKVSFEFVDTPLSEAVTFLQTLTKVNMILDPRALEANGDTPINLKVTNMTLQLALDWILKLADLDYALRDSALFISTRENLKGDVVLRIYDVRDLTEQVPDFAGPDLQLEVGGRGGGMGGGLALIGDDMGEDVTTQSLAEMIQQRVRPGEWAAELGTSIEERGGKLVVMQRPEVHRLIDKLLESFRASQKLLVTVEARFLEISEGFFEEIGIDWGSVGGGYSGEFGPVVGSDAQGIPVNNNFENAPITSDTLSGPIGPGIVPPPSNTDIFGDGTLHVIGAIANYRPDVSPEQTALGGTLGGGNSPLDEGLDMQIHYGGDMELLAFLHALRVRQVGQVLQAPRLTVFNTQRAHMFVCQQRTYIGDYEISGIMYDPIVRSFLQGVVFEVKPIVSADRRYVTLELKPTAAQLLEMETLDMNVIVHYPGSLAHVHFTIPIQFPELSLQKLRTSVTMPDGGIILIGGFMKDVKFKSETGVPFLSNLPIVGKLFRWDLTDNERRNLSVMVSSHIILFDEEEKKQR